MTTIAKLADAGYRKLRMPKIEQELDSAYFSAARSRRLDKIKQPEREKVLRHILDNRPASNLVLLSNPGVHWHFERMVEHEVGEHAASFVGIERNWSTLEFGLQYMPGRSKHHLRWRNGREVLAGVVTQKAAIFHCHIEDWPEKSGMLMDESCNLWHSGTHLEYLSINSLWIDIWQPCVRLEFAKTLRGLTGMLKSDERVPYAITCQYGRDPLGRAVCGGSVESRAEGIAAELSRNGWSASTTDCWHYFGLNDTRMMTVCGVMTPEQTK